MKRPLFIFAALLICALVAILLPPLPKGRSPMTVDEALRNLDSRDFETLRRAQRDLLAQGPTIVPRLEAAWNQEKDEVAAAIVANLIGELDAQAYFRLLMESAQTSRQSAAVKYPSGNGIGHFTVEQRQSVLSKFSASASKTNASSFLLRDSNLDRFLREIQRDR